MNLANKSVKTRILRAEENRESTNEICYGKMRKTLLSESVEMEDFKDV